jgi:hypothetical protein
MSFVRHELPRQNRQCGDVQGKEARFFVICALAGALTGSDVVNFCRSGTETKIATDNATQFGYV